MLSGSDQEFAEVDRFDLVLQSLLHVVAIDDEVSALEAGSLVGDLLHHLLDYGVESPRSQVLHVHVHKMGLLGYLLHRLNILMAT